MPMPEPQLGYFFPVSGGYPGHPLPEPPNVPGHPLPEPPPVVLPPLPPGIVMPPIYLPDDPTAMPPIVIPDPPDKPNPAPPGTIWPPLPPDAGIAGKAMILIWVVGVGYRWLVVQGTAVWPPIPMPK